MRARDDDWRNGKAEWRRGSWNDHGCYEISLDARSPTIEWPGFDGCLAQKFLAFEAHNSTRQVREHTAIVQAAFLA
jgi:hypothetical protein